MKKVIILAAGKIKEKYIADGINEYVKRLGRFCAVSVAEVPDTEYETKEKSIAEQSGLILQKMSGYCVLLDINGELLTSEELSEKIERAYTSGFDTVTFIIGGSDGVDERVKKAAHLRLSFGRMTLPHRLMRLVLAEQVYRAFNISQNTPYHK